MLIPGNVQRLWDGLRSGGQELGGSRFSNSETGTLEVLGSRLFQNQKSIRIPIPLSILIPLNRPSRPKNHPLQCLSYL